MEIYEYSIFTINNHLFETEKKQNYQSLMLKLVLHKCDQHYWILNVIKSNVPCFVFIILLLLCMFVCPTQIDTTSRVYQFYLHVAFR